MRVRCASCGAAGVASGREELAGWVQEHMGACPEQEWGDPVFGLAARWNRIRDEEMGGVMLEVAWTTPDWGLPLNLSA